MHVLKNPKPVNCIHGSDRQLTHLLVRSETVLIFRLWASSRMYKNMIKTFGYNNQPCHSLST